MTPQPKHGHLRSKAFLEFVRGLPCAFCRAAPPCDPHHWPPKGRGVTDDSRTLPCCRGCHRQAHDSRLPLDVVFNNPFCDVSQRAKVDATLRRFLLEAPRALLDQFADDLNDWRAKKGL